MYVIFSANDLVEESYLALIPQESENPPPTGLRASSGNAAPPPPSPSANSGLPIAPPVFHDTNPEQNAASAIVASAATSGFEENQELPHLTQLQPSDRPDSFYYRPTGGEPALPDLVPDFGVTGSAPRFANEPNSGASARKYGGKVDHVINIMSLAPAPSTQPTLGPGIPVGPSGPGIGAPAGAIPAGPGISGAEFPVSGSGGKGGKAVPIRNLIHPTLNEPLKNQQQITFRLVKTASDFTHSLSKLHEQHAEDMQALVEEFRRKNDELRAERPNCNNTLFNAWEALLSETETDAQGYTDIAGVFSRSVSRPLLEKTFHMKIQSRKVFLHRESYENILNKTEQMLLKCHDDYCMAFDFHVAQNNADSAMALTEAHNNYVQQLHAANGMIDQYYNNSLPHLLQELDDVYHDVSAVCAETLVQGADIVALKSGETARRYENLGRLCKAIRPPVDLNAFVKTLHIPETLTVSKHVFSPPQPSDPAQLETAPPLRDELIVDRATTNSARTRFDNLKKEGAELESQQRKLAESLDTLIRIQARSLENQLFNKANEIQEDISVKRFDQFVGQLHLSAIKSQKEMFASKVDGAGGSAMAGGAGGAGFPAGQTGQTGMASSYAASPAGPAGGAGNSLAGVAAEINSRERRLSGGSGSGTGGPAGTAGAGGGVGMKSKWVKAFKSIKGGKEPSEERVSKNGNGEQGGTPPVIENSHIFQEYTYKKITPCDICSQILRGHTRQGLKCKLCRMNVHPDCQEAVPKCQPKSRLLRRQKSASEIDARVIAGEDENLFRTDHSHPFTNNNNNHISTKNRRYSFRSMASFDSSVSSNYNYMISNSVDPREPDPVYATLREAARKRSDTLPPGMKAKRRLRKMHSRRRCYSENGLNVPAGKKEASPGAVKANGAVPSHPRETNACTPKTNQPDPPKLHGSRIPIGAIARGPVTPSRQQASPHHQQQQQQQLQLQQLQLQQQHDQYEQQQQPPYDQLPPRPMYDQQPRGGRGGRGGGMAGTGSGDMMYHDRYNYSQQQQQQQQPPSHMGNTLQVGHPSNSMASCSETMWASAKFLSNRKPKISSKVNQNIVHHQRLCQTAPSSPVQNRRLLSARNARMSSVELPDENEKSVSSASTSPCHSPKSHRLIPSNLYVVLFNFKPRHADELELKAGYKLTVIDASDKDWWKGKCFGAVGVFPATYVTKLSAGEKPLQVIQSVNINSIHADGIIKLLRDQIVIQVGDAGYRDGAILVRTAEYRQGACPIHFLQEV